MEWISDAFLVLQFSGIMGTVFYLVWVLFSSTVWRRLNPRFVYAGLKLSLIIMFVPINYLLLLRDDYESAVAVTVLPLIRVDMNYILDLLFKIWLAGVVANLILNAADNMALRRSVRPRLPLSAHQSELFEGRRRLLGVKRRISVYRSYSVPAPYIVGIIRPTIYIPMCEYDDCQLELIFTHELNHYRHGDAIWRLVAVACTVVFWYNPLLMVMHHYVDRWAEAYCDYACVKYYTKSEYFGRLLDIKVDDSAVDIPSFALKRGEYDLLWRTITMRLRTEKKIKRLAVAASVVCAITMCSVTASAATNELNAQFTDAFYEALGEDSYMELVCEENAVSSRSTEEDSYVEYEISAEEALAEGYEEVPFLTRGRTHYFNFSNIKRFGTMVSGGFNVSANSSIKIMAAIDPAGEQFDIGIIQPNGIIRYVRATDNVTHTFSVSSAGRYQLYVKNLSYDRVTISGMALTVEN